MLDGAAPLQRGTDVQECVAVDGEGLLTRATLDSGSSAAESPGEGLNVGAGGLTALDLGDGGSDLSLGGVRLEEVLRNDAASLVVGIVTRVALAGCVADLSSRSVPLSLYSSSQVFLFTFPGAKVPVWRARVGSAPMAASCLATFRVICLLPEAALEAGSWC